MTTALKRVDQFLHADGLFRPSAAARRPWWWLPAMVVFLGPVYGSVMGSFNLATPDRLLLLLYSGVKVPMLLFGTAALCLPGFYVLNTLAGLRDDFHEALQAVFAGQAGVSVALAAMAPLTRFWYFTDDGYRAALLFNGAVFAVATYAGHRVAGRYYRALIRRNARHRFIAYAWTAIYAFVGIQMGWMLRPFIGDPSVRVTFLREEPFNNAYIVVFRLLFP